MGVIAIPADPSLSSLRTTFWESLVSGPACETSIGGGTCIFRRRIELDCVSLLVSLESPCELSDSCDVFPVAIKASIVGGGFLLTELLGESDRSAFSLTSPTLSKAVDNILLLRR